jgi:hypothetical protein
MSAFENPVAPLFGLSAESRFLSLAPLDPTGLPMDLIDVNNW